MCIINCELQNRKTILLVEDSKKVQNYNKRMLERSGFDVETALTIADAHTFLEHRMPAAIILDIGMPDGSGLDFLREIRSGRIKTKTKNCSPCNNCELCIVNCASQKVPVLLLTGFSETKDIVKVFKMGSDDYLTKPYTYEVLLVRLQHLLENAGRVPETITKGMLTLDFASARVFLNGIDLNLQTREFTLLRLFMENENRLLSMEYIYEKAWGLPMAGDKSALHTAVYRLRKKIGHADYGITMARYKGYLFERK